MGKGEGILLTGSMIGYALIMGCCSVGLLFTLLVGMIEGGREKREEKTTTKKPKKSTMIHTHLHPPQHSITERTLRN